MDRLFDCVVRGQVGAKAVSDTTHEIDTSSIVVPEVRYEGDSEGVIDNE